MIFRTQYVRTQRRGKSGKNKGKMLTYVTGPYWYCFWETKDAKGKLRTRSKYIGKELPAKLPAGATVNPIPTHAFDRGRKRNRKYKLRARAVAGPKRKPGPPKAETIHRKRLTQTKKAKK